MFDSTQCLSGQWSSGNLQDSWISPFQQRRCAVEGNCCQIREFHASGKPGSILYSSPAEEGENRACTSALGALPPLSEEAGGHQASEGAEAGQRAGKGGSSTRAPPGGPRRLQQIPASSPFPSDPEFFYFFVVGKPGSWMILFLGSVHYKIDACLLARSSSFVQMLKCSVYCSRELAKRANTK